MKRAVCVALDLRYRDTDCDVEWAGRACAARMTDQGHGISAELTMGPTIGKGQDETRRSYDADRQRTQIHYCGYRLFTVQVYVTSLSQELGESAGAKAERLRTRLRTARVKDILGDANVALVQIGPNIPGDFEDEGRVVSGAVVDVRFATTDNDVEYLTARDYVASVEGTGTYTEGADGVDIESSLEVP